MIAHFSSAEKKTSDLRFFNEKHFIKDILDHPWFKVNLQSYLFPAPGQQTNIVIDTEACNEVAVKFNVSSETVRTAVQNQISCSDNNINSTDELSRYVVAYRLIIDNKVLQSQAPDFYLAPNATLNLDRNSKAHPERMMAQMLDSGPADEVGKSSQSHAALAARPSVKRPRSKWHLGIRSQSNQMHVMKEVYRALLELGFLWKNISLFKIRVRMENKRVPGRFEKMNITLYKSPRCSEKLPDYLLDFSSCPLDVTDADTNSDWGATHSTMEFFEMCSKIINKLANN